MRRGLRQFTADTPPNCKLVRGRGGRRPSILKYDVSWTSSSSQRAASWATVDKSAWEELKHVVSSQPLFTHPQGPASYRLRDSDAAADACQVRRSGCCTEQTPPISSCSIRVHCSPGRRALGRVAVRTLTRHPSRADGRPIGTGHSA